MAEKRIKFEFLEQMERLKDAAYRDSLTGLLNRGAAEIYIENTLAHLGEDENCMMLIVDLDNFKMVNDTLGHQTGDRVIRTVANVLSGLFRPGDVVARLGGDEYVVFLCGNVTRKLAEAKGKAICENLQLTVGDARQVSVSASVGIFFSTGAGCTFQEMYRMADSALYRAKNCGKNQYYVSEGEGSCELFSDEQKSQSCITVKSGGTEEHDNHGVCVIDNARDARILYADGTFCEMLGLAEREIDGRDLMDYVNSEDLTEFRAVTENAGESAGLSVSVRLRSAAGDWIYNKVDAVSIEYGNGSCILLNWHNAFQGERTTDEEEQDGSLRRERCNRWEIRLATKEFRFERGDDSFQAVAKEDCIFPDGLIGSGWIAPESADRFVRFASNVFTGRTKGYGNFLVRSGDGLEYVWATFSYRVLGDGRGVPDRVVGTIVPVRADDGEEKSGFARKGAMPVPVIDGLVAKLEANVTTDSITKTWMEGRYQENEYDVRRLSYFVVNECRRIYDRSGKVKFASFFAKEHLTKLYENGVYWFFAEYRRRDGGGYIEWVTLSMNLYKKTMEDDLRIRLRIYNSDDRHAWDCFTSLEGGRAKTTALYELDQVREIVQGLQVEAAREFCALAWIRVDGIEGLAHGDEEKLANIRDYVINMLCYALGTRCMAAEEEGRYVFVFPDVHSPTNLNQMLERAFHYSRLLLSDIVPAGTIRFFAGVCCAPLQNAVFEDLLAQARKLEERFPKVTEDKIVFHRDGTKQGMGERFANLDIERQITVLEEQKGPLDAREQQAFSDGLSDMLLAATPEKGLVTLFQRLGEFYQADRVYVISLENEARDVEVACEWKLPHLEPIGIVLSGTSMDKLRLLTQCAIEKKSMRYSATSAEGAEERDQWNYCIFPVRFSEKAYAVTDFLCLENPRNNDEGYGLVHKLLPYVENQRIKALLPLEKMDYAGKKNPAALPNLHDYVSDVPNILSRGHGTLGAFWVRIPRLSILNNQNGYAFGEGMLRTLADALARTAGEQYLYRTWDNEFIALLAEVGKEAAQERYRNLRMMLERRYGANVLLEFHWLEQFGSRELMDLPKSGLQKSGVDMRKYLKLQESESFADPLEECTFTAYVQPVFEVRTSRLVGVELLARAVNRKGGILLPCTFLKAMEHGHRIKSLDLFMLEQAFVLQEHFRQRGREELLASVNFSRQTIMDNTIVASFLAIRSRYPQQEDGRILIELPQDVGREDESRLVGIMEQLREFGAEFALDNVGVDQDNVKLLNRIRFDAVKIDHSLMVDVELSESTREVIQHVVAICAESKSKCVAEGVETKEQLEAVRRLGCMYAQGYYHGRPMTVQEFFRKYVDGGEG